MTNLELLIDLEAMQLARSHNIRWLYVYKILIFDLFINYYGKDYRIYTKNGIVLNNVYK